MVSKSKKAGKRSNHLIEGIPRECNVTAHKEKPVSYAHIFQTPINVNGHRLKAMIDSGATGNFMSKTLTESKRFTLRQKKDSYRLQIINENSLENNDETVSEETTPLRTAIQQHHEELIFDIVRMINHDIVLKMPWLKKHNLVIDWEKRVLKLERCDCVVTIQPTHRQRSMMDEKQSRKSIARCEFAALIKNNPQQESDSTGTSKGQLSQEVRVRGGTHASSESLETFDKQISNAYRSWKHLFQEEKTTAALPIHQTWDREIKLELDKQLTFEPIYALFEKKLGTLRKYLKENLRKRFIRKSQSPTGYPILFVPKKDGTLRLCVDYRKLNDITVKNRYPLSNISELQDRLSKAKYFTKLDLRGAYNLIRMKEGEEWKAAFRTRYDHYEYLIISFELTNVSATCQDLINDTLQEYLNIFVIAYLDGILMYSETLAEHVGHVSTVLKCLNKRNLRLKPQENVTFLSFTIGRRGISIDPEKIQVVKEWKTPINVKKVQFFLEFVNYNRKFIKNHSGRAVPLTRLTTKEIEWSWGEREQKAFEELWEACVAESVLKMFDSEKPIRIETDASDLAIEACLNQQYEGKWHSIAYLFRKLSPAE